jgi:hypothetical protein
MQAEVVLGWQRFNYNGKNQCVYSYQFARLNMTAFDQHSWHTVHRSHILLYYDLKISIKYRLTSHERSKTRRRRRDLSGADHYRRLIILLVSYR